jgi:hypothetical protein
MAKVAIRPEPDVTPRGLPEGYTDEYVTKPLPPTVAAVLAKAAPATEADPEWEVSLVCLTPLSHRSLRVRAANATLAKAQFCSANGISDSRGQWSIVKVG